MKRIVLATLLFAASTAHADDLIDASLSAGAGIGRVRWDGPPAPTLMPAGNSADLHMSEILPAKLLSLRGFWGGHVSESVALGARADATVFFGEANFPFSYISGGLELAGGPEVVVRRPGDKLVARFSAGAGITGLSRAVAFVAAPDNVNLAETLGGPVARALVGWSLSPHLDVSVEARAAYFFAEHTSYAPVALLVGLHATDL